MHLNAIFGLQTDCTRPGDSYYPVRAFPLWRQLVGTHGGLNTPKDKVSFLKALGVNHAVMIAAQGLLVACNTYSGPEMIFLKEHCIVLPELLLLYFIVGKYSR